MGGVRHLRGGGELVGREQGAGRRTKNNAYLENCQDIVYCGKNGIRLLHKGSK